MPVYVNLPSLIRLDQPKMAAKLDWLDDTLPRALTRAIGGAKARLRDDGVAVEGLLHPPSFSWVGAGAEVVGPTVRAALEKQVKAIIDRVASKTAIRGSAAGAATTRPWRVLETLNLRVPVRDYLRYLAEIDPQLQYEQYFLDVLHEQRACQVWLVGVDAAIEATVLYPAVVERMDKLDPLGRNQTMLWSATPREANRQALIRMDRQFLVARRTPDLDQANRRRVLGSGFSAVFLPGARLLFTRMKLPALPTVQVGAGGEAMFWDLLRKSLFGDDAGERARTIELLIELRRLPRATALLQEGLDAGTTLADMPRMGIRGDIVIALERVPERPYSVALLLLYGVLHPVEHTPQRVFRDWFKQGGGRDCLAFLERVLTEGAPLEKTKAARVVLHLLDFARTPEAARYKRSIAALRDLARRQDVFAGGPLGEESQRQLVVSQLDILIDQARVLDRSLQGSPFMDPHREQDRTTLVGFVEALEAFKPTVDAFDLPTLERTRGKLGGILLGAIEVQARVDGIHTAIRNVRKQLGSDSAESDETTVLWDLRSRYVNTLAGALAADDFDSQLKLVSAEGDDFAAAVAGFKYRRTKDAFNQAVADIINNNTLKTFSGHGPVKEPGFFDMRESLRKEQEDLDKRFNPSMIVGGTVLKVYDQNGKPIDITVESDLRKAIDLELRVTAFRVRAAMFGDLSIALLLENQIVEHEIGSSGFRTRQRAKLGKIRREVVDAWNGSKFQDYIDKSPQYANTFEAVQSDIKTAIREAIAIELLITAIAAALSFGAGLVLRAALVGRTIALVRTARAVETAVFLTEVTTFTAAQLSGQSLALGKDITFEKGATAAIENLAFLGGFRVLGKLTAPLLKHGALGFVAVHSISAATLTGVSAIATRVKSGRWPQDVGEFLAVSLIGYLLVAGTAAGTKALLTPRLNPIIEARVRALSAELGESNQALLTELKKAVDTGSLTEAQLTRIKKGLRDNIAQVREVSQQLRDAGLVAAEDHKAMDAYLKQMDEAIAAYEFNPARGYVARVGGRTTLLALPAPESLPGVARQGDTEIYRYDAASPRPEVERALTRYDEAGYGIERLPGGLIRVSRPDGRLDFVLDPAPLALPPGPQPYGLLPAAGAPTRELTLTERALGRGYLDEAQTKAIDQQLHVILPRLKATLETEFSDYSALLAMRVFTGKYPQPWVRWKIDGVRGVATMLQIQRGIPLRAVLRMFESRSPNELKTVFEQYYEIADKPGADYLVREDLRPGTSIALIKTYDALRRARIDLPADMTPKAVEGLTRWIREGRDVVAELKRIELGKRLARLEADSPLRDPRITVAPEIHRVLVEHAEAIRPGLDLFSGTPAEAAAAIEAYGQKHGGKIENARASAELVTLIQRYRNGITDFQGGKDNRRNIEGDRSEINTVIAELELGAQVLSLGNTHRIKINPALFELTRGIKLTNAPIEVEIQMDTLARTITGRLLVVEATTGDISLPEAWKALDPLSTLPGKGNASWTDLNPDRNASHRKWLQVVKLRAAALFSHKLAESWSGTKVELPELVIRVGRASAEARRTLEALGFRVIETNPAK